MLCFSTLFQENHAFEIAVRLFGQLVLEQSDPANIILPYFKSIFWIIDQLNPQVKHIDLC